MVERAHDADRRRPQRLARMAEHHDALAGARRLAGELERHAGRHGVVERDDREVDHRVGARERRRPQVPLVLEEVAVEAAVERRVGGTARVVDHRPQALRALHHVQVGEHHLVLEQHTGAEALAAVLAEVDQQHHARHGAVDQLGEGCVGAMDGASGDAGRKTVPGGCDRGGGLDARARGLRTGGGRGRGRDHRSRGTPRGQQRARERGRSDAAREPMRARSTHPPESNPKPARWQPRALTSAALATSRSGARARSRARCGRGARRGLR